MSPFFLISFPFIFVLVFVSMVLLVTMLVSFATRLLALQYQGFYLFVLAFSRLFTLALLQSFLFFFGLDLVR